MSLKVLTVFGALIFVSCCDIRANAGVLGGRIDVPWLLAKFDQSGGDLLISGMVPQSEIVLERNQSQLNQWFSPHYFHLDANFDSSGLFNASQKGSFSITDGTVVLLKGTITEASGSVFGSELQFRSIINIGGKLAPMYQNNLAVNVTLVPFNAPSVRPGFSFPLSFNTFGTAEIGLPVPEPSSLAATSSIFLLGLSLLSQRRRRVDRIAI